MANPCEKCPIVEKVACCCNSNPETGASKNIPIKGTCGMKGKRKLKILACDNLGTDGYCEIYEKRPEICKIKFCEKISQWA